MEIRYLGHAAFSLSHEGKTILIDPFLTGNPKAAAKADEVEADAILLNHGHTDHIGDTVDIAKRTGAPVLAITELSGEIGEALGGDHQVFDTHLGGTVEFDWGWVRVVPAWHTSTTPNGTVNTPAGLVISFGGKIVYHLGDTALFSDLQLVGRRDPIDVALMCIRGHHTIGAPRTPRSCASAVTHRGPGRPRSRRPSSWAPSRSSRATTTRSRRSRPTPRR